LLAPAIHAKAVLYGEQGQKDRAGKLPYPVLPLVKNKFSPYRTKLIMNKENPFQ
jgi:hypothetical protein